MNKPTYNNAKEAFSACFQYARYLGVQGKVEELKIFVKEKKDLWLKTNDYIDKKAYNGATKGVRVSNVTFETSARKQQSKKISSININEYFSKIYCLNLDRRFKDRWLNVKFRSEKAGLNISRFSAIDGYSKNIASEYEKISKIKNKYDKKLGRKAIQSPGALGCLLSVVEMIKDAKKNKYKRILLLDDDVYFHKNFEKIFNNVKNIKEWKLLYLGASQHYWSKIENFDKNFYYAKNTSGTFAIGIDQSIYQEIIDIAKTKLLPIDSYLERFIQTKYPKSCYVFRENIIIPDVSDSDIRDPGDYKKKIKSMKWNVSAFDGYKKKENINICLGVTTFNRVDYLKKFINSFIKNHNEDYNWTIVIADDGSIDGTVNYINKLRIKNVKIVKIFSNRVGVHAQTNKILKKFIENNFSYGFKADDDIFFKNREWADRYISALNKSGYDHLCYFNRSWKKENKNSIIKDREIQGFASPMHALGCFWTLTPRVIEKVGFFDTKNFGHSGYGHLDYTNRCAKAGLNNTEIIYDLLNSEEYIGMHSDRSSYISSGKVAHSKADRDRKISIINRDERIYVK